MSRYLLCDEPSIASCPPPFQLHASAWINSSNFGPTELDSDPLSGIRLRWNNPFLMESVEERLGKPIHFIVERSAPLNPASLRAYAPSVGHRSRAPTPNRLWRPLVSIDRQVFRVNGSDCTSVCAIAFTIPLNGSSAIVTLNDTDGIAQITASVRPGDDFHFECTGIKTVSFSNYSGVKDVFGFIPQLIENEEIRDFHTIAIIAADTWSHLTLPGVAERVTNAAGSPFLSIDSTSWNELCVIGDIIENAFTTNTDIPTEASAAISLVTSTSFEAAQLIGLGFVDGEHSPSPQLDTIVGPLLNSPDESVYAYRVIAHLQHPDGELHNIVSTLAFAHATLALPLTEAFCSIIGTPTLNADLTNFLQPGTTIEVPEVIEKPAIQITCTGVWEIVSHLPEVERVSTRPIAEDSRITGKPFVDPGFFINGLNRPPHFVQGNMLIERREHRFDVPYFDSDVSCEAESWDFWDRRLPCKSANMIQPHVSYTGTGPLLGKATCKAQTEDATAEVFLELDTLHPWIADPLAAYAGAVIAFYMRTTNEPMQADVEIGPPSPTVDGKWSAEIRSDLAQAELDNYVGGVLRIGSLSASIFAMGPVQGKLTRCIFEVSVHCAGADLYSCPNGWLSAHLLENLQAERLWHHLGTTQVLPSGAPAKYSITPLLPTFLKASATLYFSTRLEFVFEGVTYNSLFTAPIAAPYIHPAPEEPKTCVTTRQLATDYYGRVFIRTEASSCSYFNPEYAMSLAVASDVLTPDDFCTNKSDGLFVTQVPFEQRVLFDGFSLLNSLVEYQRYTVGISNVRTEDDRTSKPALSTEVIRKIE